MPPLEEVIEITIPHAFSDTEEMPPLEPEDVLYGESPFNNDVPIRRDTSPYVRAQRKAEIEYFMGRINALERSMYCKVNCSGFPRPRAIVTLK